MNSNDNNGKKKRHSKTKNPQQPKIIQIYKQPPMLYQYQNQVIAQPQPIYQIMPQPYGMLQPITQINTPKMVAVPVGPPIMMAKPVGPPVLMFQPVTTPQTIGQPIKKETKKDAPKIIVKKYHKPQEDDCCNIY